MARAGIASRREVERLIGLGKVAVNGKILSTPAVLVTRPITPPTRRLAAPRTPSRTPLSLPSAVWSPARLVRLDPRSDALNSGASGQYNRHTDWRMTELCQTPS